MTMINCPECGHSVSSTAAACPNCGHVLAATTTGESTHAHHTRAADEANLRGRKKRVGAGRWLAGLFFLALLVLLALWYFDIVNFT